VAVLHQAAEPCQPQTRRILFDFESHGLGKIPLFFSDTSPTDINFFFEFCLNMEEQAAGLSSLWAANSLPHLKSLLLCYNFVAPFRSQDWDYKS